MATIKELKEMALHVAKGTAPANFTCEDVASAYAAEIEEMCGSVNKFMKNKYDLYEIIIETADEIIPKKAIDVLGQFAEIQTVGQGQRAMFKRGRLGRNRAKKFITQVGLSGVYETFRLDTDTFEVRAHAIGGAARLDFERFLDGAENINELMEIIYEGLEEAVYLEVQRALKAAIASARMPARNKAITSTFQANIMQRIIGTVKAYGTDAVIFATSEFIEAMGPDAFVIGLGATNTPNIAVYPGDIEDIHNTGRIRIFRGTPIVEIPQSFVDERNEEVYIDPAFAYVLPTGGDKVVKVVFEGATQVWDYVNTDQSIEINIYKKIGVGILTYHNWGVYHNTALDVDANGYIGTTTGETGNTAVPTYAGDKLNEDFGLGL